MENLRVLYEKQIVPGLMSKFSIKNRMAVPRLVKIVINCGMGEALKDKKVIERMSEQLGLLTGQRPVVTKARKAISSFKLREGDAIGLKVTLRGKRMYDFLMRLTRVALPRVRDFRGISILGFDGGGNYSLGIREQTIFPELEYEKVDKIRGFEVTFTTTAPDDEKARALLTELGLAFEKR